MYNNTNKNSPVKIVASENTTENFNEQMETAPVSNNNESIVMNTANNQSSMAPQAGANETALGNAEDTAIENKESITSETQVDNQEGSAKIEKDMKDYTPKYDEATKEKLKLQNQVCEQAITRTISDRSIGAIPFNEGKNCIFDIRKISGNLFTPTVNRVHGADEKRTGESVMSQGAQQTLIVITGDVAQAAGIPYARFSKDPDKEKEVSAENSYILIDGNGRANFLMDIPKEEWPAIFAIFPSRDACGNYNINKMYDDINTNVSPWKTQDMVQKRILSDQENTHPGWTMINTLIKSGYKYQAACQLSTLGVDRLKKATVINGEAKDIFKNHEHAKKIFDVERGVFGDDTDVLKTKIFTKEISHLWKRLEAGYGAEEATKKFIHFVNGLSEGKVKEIKEAKSKKGGATKDELRKEILNQEFFKYIGANNISIP